MIDRATLDLAAEIADRRAALLLTIASKYAKGSDAREAWILAKNTAMSIADEIRALASGGNND